jgi:hypothetical protein
MSDDLRTRYAEALCANDGLDRSRIGYGALWGGYLEAADAVLSVCDDEREKLRVLLRSEKERADAAIEREETADEAAAEIGQYARQLERERDDYKRAYEMKPATMRLEGPGAEELLKRLTDIETSAEYWGATAPGGSLIDDLKNTIVSQAREIARLKGESA